MRYAFVMRGIPGSGKSTVAKIIAETFKNSGLTATIHSTDDLCMVDGEYKWSADLAPQRHEQNLSNFKDSLFSGDDCVICDNTNVKREHFDLYVKAAQRAGYVVAFVELPHPAPIEAAWRNSHRVPSDVITKMVFDWEPSQQTGTSIRLAEASTITERIRSSRRFWATLSFLVGLITGTLLQLVMKYAS